MGLKDSACCFPSFFQLKRVSTISNQWPSSLEYEDLKSLDFERHIWSEVGSISRLTVSLTLPCFLIDFHHNWFLESTVLSMYFNEFWVRLWSPSPPTTLLFAYHKTLIASKQHLSSIYDPKSHKGVWHFLFIPTFTPNAT